MHGGIGFTWEHDAHLYLRRATRSLRRCSTPSEAAIEVTDLVRGGVRRAAAIDLPPEAEPIRTAIRRGRATELAALEPATSASRR